MDARFNSPAKSISANGFYIPKEIDFCEFPAAVECLLTNADTL